MITVTIYGLDQFVVGRLSQEMTPSLARLYEVDEDEINFVAPENMVFHNGVEQTSWNVIIHVNAPMKVSVLQDDVARFILTSIGDVAIHKTIEFYYYSQDNRYTKYNEDYPRYITEENTVGYDDEYEDEDECDDDDCECHHHHHDEDELFTGDIFEGIDLDKKGE
ncbi:MAG: hypothetical protein J6T15_05350 [Bacilli bacterium]|nr:hypothetical protein [Bacilli bacterium]